MMPATILAPGTYHFKNTPNLTDVWTMSRLLGSIGIFCELNGDELFADSRNINNFEAPYEHVKRCVLHFMYWVLFLQGGGEQRYPCPVAAPGDRVLLICT
jgi:UDP-N-acetylglucosamine enolpyruvyl transferase